MCAWATEQPGGWPLLCSLCASRLNTPPNTLLPPTYFGQHFLFHLPQPTCSSTSVRVLVQCEVGRPFYPGCSAEPCPLYSSMRAGLCRSTNSLLGPIRVGWQWTVTVPIEDTGLWLLMAAKQARMKMKRRFLKKIAESDIDVPRWPI